VLDDKRRQEALGWRVEILNVGVESGIDLRVVDAAENGLAGLHVAGVAKRPAHEHDDRVLVFQELGAGVYRAGGRELATGVWDIVAQAERADGEEFNFSTRVMIK
jgi:nitrogen fixation protein FixH